MTQACTNCGGSFQPRPQIPNQTYCSSPSCQRARKLHWQQEKLRTDQHYRENQRDAQRAWFKRNPDYWPTYRSKRAQTQHKDQQALRHLQKSSLAKMDVSSLPSGLYRLRQIKDSSNEQAGCWLVELLPICLDCPCKKDACKERT